MTLNFEFKYGIEFETLILNKTKHTGETVPLMIIESSIEERFKLFEYLGKKINNILPIDNICPTTSSQNMWIIDEDLSVDVDIDEEDDTKINEDIRKLYYKLFDKYTNLSPALHGTLITNNEIISPPFSTINEGEQEIRILYDALSEQKNVTSYHNSRTSMHIHYSFPKTEVDTTNPNHIFNIYMAWLYFEPIIMALVPKWRNNNEYCSLIGEIAKKVNVTQCYTKIKGDLNITNDVTSVITAFQFTDDDDFSNEQVPVRYKTLNMINLILSKYASKDPIGTIEVRIKHGSCDINESMNYIRLFALFMQQAVKRGEAFFNLQCAREMPINIKRVLLSPFIDMRVKFILLANFIDDKALMEYFKTIFQKLSSGKDPRCGGQEGQSGGSKKYSKISEVFEYKGKKRTIYVGQRGARYVKLNKKYVSIKTLIRQ